MVCAAPDVFDSSWVSVDDRLPEPDLLVLVHVPESAEPVWPAYLDEDGWRWADGSVCQSAVTHWIEFPEPPGE